MSPVETVFVWLAIGFYTVTAALYIFAFVFNKERLIDRVVYFTGASFAAHTIAIVARTIAVGNPPLASIYENALGGAWVIVAFTIFVALRYKKLRGIGVATVPLALVLLGYGVMTGPELLPMAASLKSAWLVVHVFFAWLAFGSYVITFALGIIYLLKRRQPEREFYRKFPELPVMDELMFKYLVFGFITDAVMIASGAIWAKSLWGNYWSWDPVETWSLISWLIYGLAIHLYLTMGWRGVRVAWLLIVALSTVIISFFGINFFVDTSLHFFQAFQEM